MPTGKVSQKKPIWVKILIASLPVLGAVLVGYWQFGNKPSPRKEYVGRVRDAQSDKPIYKARVSIEEDEKVPQVQETDTEGIFNVNLPESTNDVRLVVEADGYEIFDRHVLATRLGIEPIRLIRKESAPPQAPTAQPSQPGQGNKNTSATSGGRAGHRPPRSAAVNAQEQENRALNALNTRSPTPRP